MTTKLTRRERAALAKVGSTASISHRINAYTAAVNRLSSKRDELVKQYPKHWVALHNDEVICTGVSLAELFRQCDEHEFNRDDVVIRYLDTEKQILIL